MTLAELKTVLTGITGFADKVAYSSFPAGAAPALPFICYLETGGDSFAADGKTYYCRRSVDVELYAAERDLASEALIEAALTNAGIYFDRNMQYLEDEKCFETIYSIEV